MKATFTEFIGSTLLLAVITGSGYMAESLSAGNAAVALLGNSIATGAGLYVLISLLGPISGAHFNPVVSFMFWVEGSLTVKKLITYIIAQVSGALIGVWLTHIMFNLPLIEVSSKSRSRLGMAISECISTLILLMVIRLGIRQCAEKLPMLIALVVTCGYWFTSSTFFANPAVTIARTFTDTFVGIAWQDAPIFILAQITALGILLVVLKMKA